jgi:hypothetical protein
MISGNGSMMAGWWMLMLVSPLLILQLLEWTGETAHQPAAVPRRSDKKSQKGARRYE